MLFYFIFFFLRQHPLKFSSIFGALGAIQCIKIFFLMFFILKKYQNLIINSIEAKPNSDKNPEIRSYTREN